MNEGERTRHPASGADWFDGEWDEGSTVRPVIASGETRAPTVVADEATAPDTPAGAALRVESTDEDAAGLLDDALEPPPPRRFRIPIKTIVFFAAALIGLYFVWPQLVGFFDAVPGLRSISWYWFVLMAVLEAACFACYWGVMRVTVQEHRWSVLAMTQLASSAFGRIVPGGAASTGSMGYHMLVASGCPKGRAITGLTATTLLSTAVLVTLPVLSLPAILAGAPVGSSLLRALAGGIVVAVLIFVGGALVLFTDRTLMLIGRLVRRVLDRVRKAGAPRYGLPARLLRERDLIKAALGEKWWLALLYAAGHRLFDFAALLAALAAVGATARPSLVLLAYVVAALLGTIPLTPGGVGFVEVGLAATLGLAGVGAAEATAAVLAYRLVSFWLPIPIGLAAGAWFTRRYGGRVRAARARRVKA